MVWSTFQKNFLPIIPFLSSSALTSPMLQLADIFYFYSISEFVCSVSKIHNSLSLYHHICLKKNIKYVLHITGAQTNLFLETGTTGRQELFLWDYLIFHHLFHPYVLRISKTRGAKKIARKWSGRFIVKNFFLH